MTRLERIKMQIYMLGKLPKIVQKSNNETGLMELMKYESRKMIMKNPFKDRRYTIRCSKCGLVFDYGYEDMRIEMTRDMSGKNRVIRDEFVECPNCSREYDFGYESKGCI